MKRKGKYKKKQKIANEKKNTTREKRANQKKRTIYKTDISQSTEKYHKMEKSQLNSIKQEGTNQRQEVAIEKIKNYQELKRNKNKGLKSITKQ